MESLISTFICNLQKLHDISQTFEKFSEFEIGSLESNCVTIIMWDNSSGMETF